MSQFLPTWGIPASRTKVYDYLSEMRLPKKYVDKCQTDSRQTHHDYFIFWSFIPIATGFHDRGLTTRSLEKGSAVEGERFRHDFKFCVDDYLYYIELQLSDLAQTRWRQKIRQYVRYYRKIKRPFRVLFVLDQHGSMTYVRSHARAVLKEEGHSELNLFLFTNLGELRKADNPAVQRIWWSVHGGPKERISLLES
ncbi:hypothetical protein Pan258_01700 [Symmachiella dynata]|nr:hypothetical protein Pan258_01700 [Symmachiella dynata]